MANEYLDTINEAIGLGATLLTVLVPKTANGVQAGIQLVPEVENVVLAIMALFKHKHAQVTVTPVPVSAQVSAPVAASN